MNLLDMLKDAGIIGAGGAGFPTHAKLASKAEYILLNGAECEPLLRVDQQLMAMFPDEIIKGFEAAGRLVDAKMALIGIKRKHKDVIAIINDRITALQLGEYVQVRELPDVYPAGDEQVLVFRTDRQSCSGSGDSHSSWLCRCEFGDGIKYLQCFSRKAGHGKIHHGCGRYFPTE